MKFSKMVRSTAARLVRGPKGVSHVLHEVNSLDSTYSKIGLDSLHYLLASVSVLSS